MTKRLNMGTPMRARYKGKKPPFSNGFLFPGWENDMATVVKQLPAAKPRQNGTTKYDKWLDGQVWKFTKKDQEQLNLKTLRSGLYRVGRAKGLQVIFREEDGNIFVQALPRPQAGD
jgi:hypothetical protein